MGYLYFSTPGLGSQFVFTDSALELYLLALTPNLCLPALVPNFCLVALAPNLYLLALAPKLLLLLLLLLLPLPLPLPLPLLLLLLWSGQFPRIAGNSRNHGNDGKVHKSHQILYQTKRNKLYSGKMSRHKTVRIKFSVDSGYLNKLYGNKQKNRKCRK